MVFLEDDLHSVREVEDLRSQKISGKGRKQQNHSPGYYQSKRLHNYSFYPITWIHLSITQVQNLPCQLKQRDGACQEIRLTKVRAGLYCCFDFWIEKEADAQITSLAHGHSHRPDFNLSVVSLPQLQALEHEPGEPEGTFRPGPDRLDLPAEKGHKIGSGSQRGHVRPDGGGQIQTEAGRSRRCS